MESYGIRANEDHRVSYVDTAREARRRARERIEADARDGGLIEWVEFDRADGSTQRWERKNGKIRLSEKIPGNLL